MHRLARRCTTRGSSSWSWASARSQHSGTLCRSWSPAGSPGRWPTSHSLRSCSYALGFPDNVRSRRQAWLAGAVAGLSAIAAISMFQLLAKSVLLPRSVVLGAGVLLVPWFVLCASLACVLPAARQPETNGWCSSVRQRKPGFSVRTSRTALSGPPCS